MLTRRARDLVGQQLELGLSTVEIAQVGDGMLATAQSHRCTEQIYTDLRGQAQTRLNELWATALKNTKIKYPRSRSMPQPSLHFFRRRADAGVARLNLNRIDLNEDFLERYPDAMLGETIAHELAHLIVHRYCAPRARSHGSEWRAVMWDWFGVQGQRTHHFDTHEFEIRRQRVFPYQCNCREHQLTTVRHRRASRGWTYLCTECAGPLRPQAQDLQTNAITSS